MILSNPKYKFDTSVARGDLGPAEITFPTSKDIKSTVEQVTGPFYEPQNQAERDAATAGNFAATAVLQPGGAGRKIVQSAIPAAADIIAGRYSDQNPYVKALAAFVTGVGTSAAVAPGATDRLLRSKIPSFVTEQHITDAGKLIQQARSGPNPVDLTWPEALSKVTGRPVLTDLQRFLESHPRTRPAIESFMAPRAQQVENRARGEIQNVGATPANPYALGPQAGKTMENVISRVEAGINDATRPLYDAAEKQRVGPSVHAAITSDPLYAKTLKEIRDNPALNRTIEHLPDDSVGVIDLVQKRMREQAQNARVPGTADTSNLAALNLQDARTVPLAAADTLTGSRPAIPPSVTPAGPAQIPRITPGQPAVTGVYETARREQARLRSDYLEPLMAGPIGKIAGSDRQTQTVIDMLFGKEPLANSEGQIGAAVRVLAQQRPAVAEGIVRTYLEGTLNNAAQALQGGANQFTGAKVWKDLVGHPQEKANLKAAIEALPNGADKWAGLEKMLDVMEATGKRQAKGSLTAFNTMDASQMTTKGVLDLATNVTNLKKWQTLINDTYRSWSEGRNLKDFSDLILNPQSGDALKRLVNVPVGNERAMDLAARMLTQATGATTQIRQ